MQFNSMQIARVLHRCSALPPLSLELFPELRNGDCLAACSERAKSASLCTPFGADWRASPSHARPTPSSPQRCGRTHPSSHLLVLPVQVALNKTHQVLDEHLASLSDTDSRHYYKVPVRATTPNPALRVQVASPRSHTLAL